LTEDSEQAELARAIDNLLKRLEKIGGGDWIPAWLTTVGSREEIAEWKAICKTYRGLDRSDRIEQFIKAMRKKHPNMPLTLEEDLTRRVEELKRDKELARREGIPEEYIQGSDEGEDSS
jgi:hypothetical protein